MQTRYLLHENVVNMGILYEDSGCVDVYCTMGVFKISVLIKYPEKYKFLCIYGKRSSGVSTVQYTLYLHPSLSLSFLSKIHPSHVVMKGIAVQ